MSGTLMKIGAFAVFLSIGFAAVPLMLRLFLAGQRYIGNAGHPLVRMLGEHQALVVGGVWCIFAAGLAIATPVMIKDEVFGAGPRIWLETLLAGRTHGVLVANVGMTVEEIRRRSTVPLPKAGPDGLTGATNLIGEVVFDWEIADAGTRFERCRYYFIVTRPKGDVHVRSMNVGISPRALPRAEHDEAMRRTQERLRADGWASGRYVLLAEGRGLDPPRAQARRRRAAPRGPAHRRHMDPRRQHRGARNVELLPGAGVHAGASSLKRASSFISASKNAKTGIER